MNNSLVLTPVMPSATPSAERLSILTVLSGFNTLNHDANLVKQRACCADFFDHYAKAASVLPALLQAGEA